MVNLLKIIHHFSAVSFIGSITIILIQKVYAEKSNEDSFILYSLKVALFLDKIITIPTVIFTTISGIILIVLNGTYLLKSFWLQVSFFLWICSALVASLYLIPSLKKLKLIAEKEISEGKLSYNYFKKANKWNVISLCLILSPIIIFVLMIVKPIN